jgi:26S proteasome regulatory subunit N9
MAVEVLTALSTQNADLADSINALIQDYNQKLWHPLTTKLLTLVNQRVFDSGTSLLPLKDTLLRDVHTRINPLSLVNINLRVMRQESDLAKLQTDVESLKALPSVKNNDIALLLCETAIADILLTQGKEKDAKTLIESLDERFGDIDGVSAVHRTFYDVSSRYYQIQADHARYYRDALRYLGCINVESDLTEEERQKRALFLALSAVLGKGVYNFGELLAHPVLDSLKNSADNAWVAQLVFAFNSGDIAKFDSLKPRWSAIPDLANAEVAMRQKISLLALMEMAFRQPANNRHLSFSNIAQTVHISLDEVELLAMKALSLNLIKGTIDQVEQIVHVTWVSPRVLSRDQLAVMSSKLLQWQAEIVKVETLINTGAQSIIGY